MSAEIIPSERTIDRRVPFVLYLVKTESREMHIERIAESDRTISTTKSIGLFIDPEVV